MSSLITLTGHAGRPMRVNPVHLACMVDDHDGGSKTRTFLFLSGGGEPFPVRETQDEVLAIIEAAEGPPEKWQRAHDEGLRKSLAEMEKSVSLIGEVLQHE